MRRSLIVIFLAAFAALTAAAQAPLIDGVIAEGEYRFVETKSGIRLASSLSPDGATLYLAVSAATKGWVAFGVGSSRMNGAYMIIAYQEDGGAAVVSEETGVGHGHRPNARRVATAVVRERDGVTTLEASFPTAAFVQNGQVQAIAAIGNRDNLSSLHRARASFVIRF